MSKGSKSNNNLPAIGELQEMEKSPIKDWELVKLGDILSLEYGENLPSGKRENGDIPVYGSNGKIGEHSEAYVNSPGIIVGRKGSIGETSFSEIPFWPIDTTYYISPEETEQNLKYLYYLLNHLKLERFNAASAIPGLNRDDAYNLKTILPSIHEQRMIASVLLNTDRLIHKSQEIIEESERIKKGLMKELLLPSIAQVGKLQTLKKSPKKGWELKKLGEILKFEYGKSLPEKDRENGDFPVYGSNGQVDTHSEYFVNGPGIIVGRKGSIGELVYSENDFWPIDTTYYITKNETKENLKFLYYLLEIMQLKRINAASAVPGLNRNDVYGFKALIPPKDIQEKIVNQIEAIDRIIINYRREKNQLKQLKKGLMQDLLTGKVRTKDKPIKVLEEVKRYG
ncbi:MAG: restriction endonuclease subunit S [Elusimicrobiota bacterium]